MMMIKRLDEELVLAWHHQHIDEMNTQGKVIFVGHFISPVKDVSLQETC